MVGSVITRSAHPSALWPGVQAWFGKYADMPKQYTQIFDVRRSTKWQERVVENTGFGYAPEKAEGASVTYDTTQEGYTALFTHIVYALGYIVTEEELEDNQYKQLSQQRSGRLANSMNKTKENVHADILNRQQNGAYLGGDGVPLVSAAHPTMNGTQTNLIPAADLSEASLEAGLNLMYKARDSRGLKIQLKAKQLITSNQEIFNATRILESELQNFTDFNAVNAIKLLGAIPQMIYNDFLDDDDAWFIQTDAMDGLICYERRATDFQKYEDFDTSNAKAKSTNRYAAGWGDWRGLYGNAGS